MGNPGRLWQLRWQNVTLNLNAAPYTVLSGAGTGQQLDVELRVEDASAAAVERHLSALRRILRAGSFYGESLTGYPLYIYTKRCDEVDPVAELGATWRRARVQAGSAQVIEAQPPHLVQKVRVSLELAEGVWRRAAPASVLSGSSLVTPRPDGGLAANSASVTARRLRWTATTGITARYHWLYGAGNCTFFKVNANLRGWWDEAAKRFKIGDNAGVTAQTSTYPFTVGQEVEVVFRWSPGVGMAIFVNGAADATAGSCAVVEADPYTVFEPTGNQSLLNAQIWPAALTDAQCSGLAVWGRPEAELAFYVAPPNGQNRNQQFRLYNTPGEVGAPLRLILNDATNAYDRVRIGLRPLRAPTNSAWEAEAGTLGANTVKTSDLTASGGEVARFTPADTNWATRVTVTLAQDADDVAALFGEHHVYLAGRDQAANANINRLRWRVVLAGVAEPWSDEVALATVGNYSLCDLGLLNLPPGGWPDESETVSSDVYPGAYATLEIQVRNITGNGGGALDLDAVFLAPAEREATATAVDLTTGQFLVLDWLSRQPAAIAVYDWRQMEFAGWAELTDEAALALEPAPSAASLLWLWAYRNTSEQGYPLDTISAQLQLLPGWQVG